MPKQTLEIIYDGDCPVCKRVTMGMCLKEASDDLVLVNVREHPKLYTFYLDQGMDLDQGMIVKRGEEIYFGADAMHMLAMLSSDSRGLNRLIFLMSRNRSFSRFVYPVFRFLRLLLLRMLGRKPIGTHDLNSS